MECFGPIPSWFERVYLTDARKGKHPKLLGEEIRHRWKALEEEPSKRAAAREWKEERSSSTHTS